MRINHVEATNFKGNILDMDIPAVLVLTGENGSGKSRIPEACITAMIGSIPWTRYKTAKAIFENFATSGAEPVKTYITLTNEAGDDIPIRRTIKMTGSTVKQKLEYMGVNKLQEAQDTIDEDLSLCAEALDFAKFENLSPREQQLYLLGLVKIPDVYEKNSLLEQISQSLMNATQRHYKTCEKCTHCAASTEGFKANDPAAHRTNDVPMGYGECSLEVGKRVKLDDPGCANWEGFDDWEDELNSLHSISAEMVSDLFEAWDDSRGTRENIEALEERSRNLKTKVQNEVSRLTKLHTAQFDVEVKTMDEDGRLVIGGVPVDAIKEIIGIITGTLAQVKARLDELRERKEYLIAEIEKETAKINAHANWLKDHRDFQSDVDKGNERYNGLLQQQREGKFPAKIEAVKKKIQTAEWYEQKQQELNDLEAKRPDLHSEKKAIENAIIRIRAEVETYETSKRKFSEEHVQCPLCPSMGCPTTKKQKQTIVESAIPEISKLEKEVVEASKTHDEVRRDYDELITEIDTATAEFTEAKTNDASYALTIRELKGKEKALTEAIDLAKKNLDRDNERLSNHLANDKRIDSSDETEKLKAELMNVKDNIRQYESTYERKSEEATRERDREITNTLLREAKQQLILSRELVRIVGPSGILGDVLTASLIPMIATINEFLPDGHFCFINPKGEGIDIGMNIEGKERSLMSLSDGEKSFFAAATALAFMVLQEANLRLLVINRFEGIDAKKQVALLKKIVPATEKYSIQFIGCSCWPTPHVDGVEIIDLGGIK